MLTFPKYFEPAVKNVETEGQLYLPETMINAYTNMGQFSCYYL